MATSEERLKILKMIQSGKITAEEGAQLIELLDRRSSGIPAAGPGADVNRQAPGKGPHWFRVRITDTNTGRPRVNVRMPVSLVSAGIKMGARFSPEVEGLDAATLMHWINTGETGQVVDVFDDDDGEHVEVFLE